MAKQNLAVIFGGRSPEYGVSLASAGAVIQNLNREKYAPVLIGISRQGDWFHYTGPAERVAGDAWLDPQLCAPAALSLSRSRPGLLRLDGDRASLLPLDAALPILHGRDGEDGTVQGLFTLAGIPLAGCGVLASALCMDKDRAHKLAACAGIKTPRGGVLRPGFDRAGARELARSLGFPLFVKPVRAGSSFGIRKVWDERSLPAAIQTAFQYDGEVLLEQAVDGFEVGCAVLGTDTLFTGAVDEIELSRGFFDYTEKYALKTSAIHVPARVSPEKAEEIKETAKVIYRALGCTGFARVDQFLTPAGELIFNEVNTIPGFTEHSRYPGMMRAAGLSFGEMLDRMIAQAAAV